jgi:uncharacterized protein (DUF952 family)
MRWLYHVALRADVSGAGPYAPASLSHEGFIHASFRDRVLDSARLYFAPGADLLILQIDPRRLDARVDVVETPRGPMPHIHGTVARAAIVATFEPASFTSAPDAIEG